MNSGITLLRCLLMYLIVLHHTICHTLLGTNGWLFMVFLLTVPAVDGFLAISGWFGIKFSWRKLAMLAGQIVYYAVLSSVLSIALFRLGLLEHPIVAVGNAWYGVAYLALMLVCPVVNEGLRAIEAQGRTKSAIVAVSVLLIGDYLSRNLGLGFSVNGFGSHTFSTFLLVYMLVWMLRGKRVGWLGVLCAIVYMVWFGVWRYLSPGANCVAIIAKAGFYNCPLVVMIAFGLVSLFSRLRVPNWLAWICNAIAPSMFAVYLLHDASPTGKMLLISRPGATLTPFTGVVWSMTVFFMAIAVDILVRRFPIWVVSRVALGERK